MAPLPTTQNLQCQAPRPQARKVQRPRAKGVPRTNLMKKGMPLVGRGNQNIAALGSKRFRVSTNEFIVPLTFTPYLEPRLHHIIVLVPTSYPHPHAVAVAVTIVLNLTPSYHRPRPHIVVSVDASSVNPLFSHSPDSHYSIVTASYSMTARQCHRLTTSSSSTVHYSMY